MSIYDDPEDYGPYDWRNRGGTKAGKIAADSSRHYPNKDEGHILRQIMAQTGLTEAQVRADIKYRRMLAKAQKQSQVPKRSTEEKLYAKLLKRACQQTKLAKEHPETIRVLQSVIDKEIERMGWFFRQGRPEHKFLTNLTAKKLIERLNDLRNLRR